MASVAYEVTGMTCEHCSRAVSAELRNLAGVTDVRVDLVPDGRSSVLVVSETPLAVPAVVAALDEAGGYRLADG
ncbi:MAG TPA: heavy-metal-associated domain-containing protein [Streptosporangiaceae bacterium]|nr:heavy-metal-associated domain-containing protein [Streptosporangiaceae bacterium]